MKRWGSQASSPGIDHRLRLEAPPDPRVAVRQQNCVVHAGEADVVGSGVGAAHYSSNEGRCLVECGAVEVELGFVVLVVVVV